MILLTIKLPTVPEIEPPQRQRSGHLYKKERNGPASADLAYLHPAKTATTGTACRHYARPPPSILPFLLARYCDT